MKLQYEKPEVLPLILETESLVLASSVDTTTKKFTVETGDYEIDYNWFDKYPSFD